MRIGWLRPWRQGDANWGRNRVAVEGGFWGVYPGWLVPRNPGLWAGIPLGFSEGGPRFELGKLMDGVWFKNFDLQYHKYQKKQKYEK